MQNNILKKGVILVLIFICNSLAVFSQTYVNKEWSVMAGNPLLLQWSNSIRISSGELLTVGNTQVAGQGANILLTKYKTDGTIIWTTNYNTSGTKNDYGTNLITDGSGNIYVCGTTDNNGIVNYDAVVLKYNSSGSLLWDTTYNSPYSKNDIASSIVVDNANNIYIGASSEGDTTQFDFLTLGYSNTGVYQWASRYNYASLHDYAVGLSIDNNTSLLLTGTSASNTTNWDFTTVKYNLSGTQIGVVRNSVAGSGYDQPYAYAKDNNGNVYVTGKGSTNGTDYDMKTIKINSTLAVVWNVTYNGANAEDQGNAIAIDQNNDVLVGGYYTNTANRQVARIIKYDNAGNELWNYERTSDYATGNAQVKAMDIDVNDNSIYALIEQTGVNNYKDLALVKLNVDGAVEWERVISSMANKLATGVKYNTDGSIYITYVRDLIGATSYTVERYSEYVPSDDVDIDTTGKPIQMKNELVIRFVESALNYNAIDNANGNAVIEFNDLSYFLKQNESNIFYSKLQNLCSENPETPCKIIATKIFHDLKTGSSKTVNRLGDTIKIPNFWACLRVIFPSGINKQSIIDSLKNLNEIVVYAEPNFIPELHASFNDSFFAYQYGFYQNNAFPNSDVNIAGAWDYTTGNNNVKICINDDGIQTDHNDFKVGPMNNTSKITATWNAIDNNASIPPYVGEHGTMVTGVIGAQTNNNKGVSGICGGAYSSTFDNGAKLYVNRITSFLTVPIVYVYNAIVNACIDSIGSNTKWGVHIMNNSYGLTESGLFFTDVDTNFQLLKEASHFANRANVTFVASRGNAGNTVRTYPATADDDWVLNVGGSGLDGEYANGYLAYPPGQSPVAVPGASYGYDVDVIAPYRSELTYTTKKVNNFPGEYTGFNGTSSAAAYVSGVAGLLMSYLNDPIPSYKNMAPEDIENILQYSATDVDSLYYDVKTGHGRLNAGAAFELISKPKHQVMHFGTNPNSSYTKTVNSVSIGDTIYNKEWYSKDGQAPWYKPGKYIMDIYRIDAKVNHNLNSVDTIQRYWARPSGSTLLQKSNIANQLLARERIVIDSMFNSYAILHGYVYKVSDSLGNFITWWPYDTTDLTKAKFEYTLLTKNGSSTNINELVEDDYIRVYPNPSQDLQTISFKSNSITSTLIELYDISGRKIDNIFEGKCTLGVNKINSNIEILPIGVYYYKIVIGKRKYIKKLIKS